MKDEIKEILDSIQEHLKENEEKFKKGAVDSTVYYLHCDDARTLLDYKTNLQERIDKAIEMFNHETLIKYYYGMSYEFEINDFKEDMLNILQGSDE